MVGQVWGASGSPQVEQDLTSQKLRELVLEITGVLFSLGRDGCRLKIYLQ